MFTQHGYFLCFSFPFVVYVDLEHTHIAAVIQISILAALDLGLELTSMLAYNHNITLS